MGVGVQRHNPAALPPRKRPGTHCIGGWVGPRAGLDVCGKSLPPPGFDLLTVQPVASRYTDCAIPALYINSYGVKIRENFISTALRTYKLAIHFILSLNRTATLY
jgi:hypothetical protein